MTSERSEVIDLLKAMACVMIVFHHLALYGPMSETASAWLPGLVGFFYTYALLAVQVFLVVGGYLNAKSLTRALDQPHLDFQSRLLLRYRRLVIPLLAALSFTVAMTALVRPFFPHSSLSEAPQWGQVLAHIFLLQDVFHLEAFSAGVWYVAIDFQLFVMALLSAFLACKWQSFSNQGSVKQKLLVLWLTISIISSLIWNLNAKGDMWGTYFFGAYGLGLCVGIWREAFPKVRYRYLIFGIVVLGVLATLQQARVRLGVAMVTACLLSIYEARGCPSMPIIQWRWVRQLSNASYAIFLIHFGVSLCVSAVVFNFWPGNIPLNLAGMLTSFGISVALGQLIHRVVEKQEPTWRRVGQWVATFVATCAAVMLVA